MSSDAPQNEDSKAGPGRRIAVPFAFFMAGLGAIVAAMWLCIPGTTVLGAVFMMLPHLLLLVNGLCHGRVARLWFAGFGIALVFFHEWAMKDYMGTVVHGSYPCANAPMTVAFGAYFAVGVLTAARSMSVGAARIIGLFKKSDVTA